MSGATAPSAGFPRQVALDGLRGIAVLMVVAYHLAVVGADGGSIGVDVFFVLSGYLITSLLVVERGGTGRVDLIAFWGRRIRRLLPALLLLLVLVGVYALVAAPPEQLERIREDGLATLFYVQNWHLASTTGLTSPLSHTWSLAIEEQWYLVWPPIFLGLAWLARGRNRILFGVALGLAVTSAFEMGFLGETRRAYFGTDSRAQVLLLGAALAFLLQFAPGPVRRGSSLALEGAGVVGLVVLGVVVVQPPAAMSEGGYFLVGIACVAVIAAAVQPSSPLLRPVLAWRPLVALGLISYGVYLYHYLVIVWLNAARTGLGTAPLAILRIVVTLGIATASYFVIEMPVRRGTFPPRRWRAVVGAVAVGITVVIVVLTTSAARVPKVAASDRQLWMYMRNTTPEGERRVLLLGDSLASEVALAMHGPFDAAGIRGLALGSFTCPLGEVIAATPPASLSPECRRHRREVRTVVRAYEPDVIVVGYPPGEETTAAVTAKELRDRGSADAVRAVAVVTGREGTAAVKLTRPQAQDLWSGIAGKLDSSGP